MRGQANDHGIEGERGRQKGRQRTEDVEGISTGGGTRGTRQPRGTMRGSRED